MSGERPNHGGYQGLIGQAASRTPIDPPVGGDEDRVRGEEGGEPRRGPIAGWLFAFRYAVPAVLIVGGVIWAAVDWPEGAEAFSLFTGAGLSILLLNVLFRIGVKGDAERDEEEEARRYFDRHGHWPDGS